VERSETHSGAPSLIGSTGLRKKYECLLASCKKEYHQRQALGQTVKQNIDARAWRA
jgi:hypothetical protein